MVEKDNFKKSSYDILVILKNNDITGVLNAVTITYLAEKVEYSRGTILSELKKMILQGYVEKGLRQGKGFTYYITAVGLEKLKEFE